MRFDSGSTWHLGLLSLACAALIGSSPAAPGDLGHLGRIRAAGNLVMLTVPHQESVFARVELETGPMRAVGTVEHFKGVDVDLMAKFAHRLGVELEVRPATGADGIPIYRELIPALVAGKGDVIASSFSITPERSRLVAFSQPYYSTWAAVVVRSDGPIRLRADLAGKRGAVVAGSSQEQHLLRFGFRPEDLLRTDFQLENYTAVLEGQADFTVQDALSARQKTEDYPELRIAFPLTDDRDGYGFAVPQGSDLLPELDRFVAEIRASGELEQVLERWHANLAD